jgi:hypothetical protein
MVSPPGVTTRIVATPAIPLAGENRLSAVPSSRIPRLAAGIVTTCPFGTVTITVVAPGTNPLPVIVMIVPPLAGPDVGLSDVAVGGA